MSILDAYLYFNSINNYTDINITSENFFCDLLNILFGYHLTNANRDKSNQSGFDLIDKKNKIVFQISSTNRPQKIINSINQTIKLIEERKSKVSYLEKYKSEHHYLLNEDKRFIESAQKEINKIPDIENGRIRFLFLKRKKEMSEVMNYKGLSGRGYTESNCLKFDCCSDILCFDDLISYVNNISEKENSTLTRLQNYMQQNSNLFIRRQDIAHRMDVVDSVIKEYADNFTAPMFLHIYKSNKDTMTLKNIYVEPNLSPILNRCGDKINNSSNIVEVLDDFLWNKEEVRMLFIDGDAAIGKTSLISWLCYHYKELDEIGKAIFCGRRVLCIRLRELDFDNSKCTEECILKYLKIDSIEEMESRYSDTIIVLEGADELSMGQGTIASSIEQFLLEVRKLYRSHKIIVTSRPKFINMETVYAAGEEVYHFCIQHFDSTMRKKWLNNYQHYEDVPESIKTYIEEITDLEADGVADTPLALYLLVASNARGDLGSNRWNLFYEIFNNAIITTRYNENMKCASAHPAFSNGKSDVLYNLVGEVAWKMFQDSSKEKYFITNRELDTIIQAHEYTISDQEVLKKSCVLCAYWKKNSKEGVLEFYHNDIRDFFFGEYIYTLAANICNTSFDDKKYDSFIKLCAQLLQYGIISKTTWEQTYSFIYWRLRHDNVNSNENNQIDTKKLRQHFSGLVKYMLANGTLWEYPYSGIHYTHIKNTVINGCLLLKIMIEPELCNEHLRLWENTKEHNFWHSTQILIDWKELLTSKIAISKSESISFVSNLDFEDFDFSGKDLKKAHFYKTKFNNANFKVADLSEASFQGSQITDTSFAGASVSRVSFRKAEICNTDFNKAIFFETDFTGAILKNVDFSEATFENVIFNDTSLVNVKLPKKIDAELSGCDIHFVDLSGCDLKGKIIKDTKMRKVTINKTNLKECRLYNVTMEDVSWDNVKFDGAELENCHFNNCKGKQISLNKTRILSSELKKCVLLDSNLLYTIIRESDIVDVNFEGSSLRELKIEKSRTDNVSCRRCDFLRAIINDEVLNTLDLKGAYNLNR